MGLGLFATKTTGSDATGGEAKHAHDSSRPVEAGGGEDVEDDGQHDDLHRGMKPRQLSE